MRWEEAKVNKRGKKREKKNIPFLLQLISIFQFQYCTVHSMANGHIDADGVLIVWIEMEKKNLVPLFAWWINVINWYVWPTEYIGYMKIWNGCKQIHLYFDIVYVYICVYCDCNSILKYFYKLMCDFQDSHSL